jgi:hypothetical protein
MNQLAMNVLSFLGEWFVVSLVLGLFVGACIGDTPPVPMAAGRQMLPAWVPGTQIERRRTHRNPVADRRVRRAVRDVVQLEPSTEVR